MSPSHVLEPTYEKLRQRLLLGIWPPGFRLEANRLADDLGVSMTPVRDSLNRLVGERLVHALVGEGFRVPRLDETEVRVLLNWQELLIGTALHASPLISGLAPSPKYPDDTSARTAWLFTAMTDRADDPELKWAIESAGARLSPYRRQEDKVLVSVPAELDALETAFRLNARDHLAQLVRSYHTRRREMAGELAHRARLS